MGAEPDVSSLIHGYSGLELERFVYLGEVWIDQCPPNGFQPLVKDFGVVFRERLHLGSGQPTAFFGQCGDFFLSGFGLFHQRVEEDPRLCLRDTNGEPVD